MIIKYVEEIQCMLIVLYCVQIDARQNREDDGFEEATPSDEEKRVIDVVDLVKRVEKPSTSKAIKDGGETNDQDLDGEVNGNPYCWVYGDYMEYMVKYTVED